MSDKPGALETLEDRPELESAVREILPVDDEQDSWTFDDVPVDSGRFGELVSAGIVEKADGQYRLADPEAVRAVLDGDVSADAVKADRDGESVLDGVSLEIDARAAALFAGALAVVALARTYVVGSIYRGGDIVLSGNDPYYYRYHVEQVAAEASHAADVGALSVLPEGLTKGEPLMVATLWWVASLFGGSEAAIGHVLAWYPVVSALVSAALLYLLALRVTNDRRVGLAAVLFLAFIPGHAFRTSLGFADHHAFDYPWLGLTALSLAVILTATADRDALRDPLPWLGAGALGVGVAGQVLAWEAGPLLLLPIGLAVAGQTLLDVDAGRSSLLTNSPVLAGVGLGAGLTGVVHLTADWQTTLVAIAPALLAGGIVVAVAAEELLRRVDGTARQLAAVDIVAGVLAIAAFRFGFPEQWAAFGDRLGTLLRSGGVAETYGLFSTDAFGFLFLLGLTLPLALPAMGRGLKLARDGHRGWLVVGSYGWLLFGLAVLQVRFVGELAVFLALFAGYTFVWAASWVDIARPVTDGAADRLDVRVPDARTVGSLVVLFLLFGSLGLVQVPVKTSQVTISDGAYGAASAMEDDATERQLDYPENYVLSRWGRNRMYNYFVNGESESYGYAEVNYGQFLSSRSPRDAYNSVIDGDVGYVVLDDLDVGDRTTMYSRLYESYGSRRGNVSGLEHYQALYVSDSGRHRAFAVVPGATIRGTAAPNATVTVATTRTVSGTSFEYVRQVEANATGTFAVTVANPGTYAVTTSDSGERGSVDVSQTAVYEGGTVDIVESAQRRGAKRPAETTAEANP
ncbi:STT3 domain-containing protein [Haloarcula salina]|uniref:STT3 domain-containing protein n=1 Tax=Haloarcula salina TaxID=1429914 RepID=UPI003C6EA71D